MLLKLALFAGIALLGTALALWKGQEKATFITISAHIRQLGPVTFFAAMAVLPTLGCPLALFTLSAAPLFAERLGLPWVLALSLAALAGNLALSYVLGRFFLRRWVGRLLVWLGYKLPEVKSEDQAGVTVLIRVVPGPPFFLQNYLLALIAVRFGTYLGVSWVIASAYIVVFVLFGESLAQGRGKLALLAAGLLIALIMAVNLIRRHYTRKSAIALSVRPENDESDACLAGGAEGPPKFPRLWRERQQLRFAEHSVSKRKCARH